ncbi:hypothetical protein [Pseudoduganella violacea]|uniref:DUF1640 domain-containing protein n=1 Tax=Pseudoduganella violacea TaxID=1715466 RepID=A0A7W5FSW6_9BURK|nr:hypothetical protein [Pseudoduganella violacea]MBB3118190.1 hypothetical protein [Pseudoduganella violacea]
MPNDESQNVRLSFLDKQMNDVMAELTAMRREYATKTDLEAVKADIARLEARLDSFYAEFVAMRLEHGQRLAAIEAQLPHLATKAEMRKLALITTSANIAAILPLYMLLLHQLF